MWTSVASRKHTLHKIFPFGNDATEVMLYGSVELGMRSGSTVEMDWAGRAQLVKESDGEYRMSFYQVFLVSRLCTGYLFWVFGLTPLGYWGYDPEEVDYDIRLGHERGGFIWQEADIVMIALDGWNYLERNSNTQAPTSSAASMQCQ